MVRACSLRAAQLGLLIVQAVAEASQQRRHLAPRVGARRGPGQEGRPEATMSLARCSIRASGRSCTARLDGVAPLHERADVSRNVSTFFFCLTTMRNFIGRRVS